MIYKINSILHATFHTADEIVEVALVDYNKSKSKKYYWYFISRYKTDTISDQEIKESIRSGLVGGMRRANSYIDSDGFMRGNPAPSIFDPKQLRSELDKIRNTPKIIFYLKDLYCFLFKGSSDSHILTTNWVNQQIPLSMRIKNYLYNFYFYKCRGDYELLTILSFFLAFGLMFYLLDSEEYFVLGMLVFGIFSAWLIGRKIFSKVHKSVVDGREQITIDYVKEFY